jgi:hypothetical protein
LASAGFEHTAHPIDIDAHSEIEIGFGAGAHH